MSSLFTSQTPVVDSAADGAPGITTATSLVFAKNGTINAVRFYATNATLTGSFIGLVWEVTTMDGGGAGAGAGTLLVSKTMPVTPTAAAWNLITLDTPLAVTTGKVYRVGLWTEKFYVATNNFFNGATLTNGDITAYADGTTGLTPSGTLDQGTFVIDVTPGTYPKNRGTSASYFIDVDFTAAAASSAPGSPNVVTAAPSPQAARPAILLRPAVPVIPVATPRPLIVTAPQPPVRGAAVLIRRSLIDAPVLTTVRPLVVTAPVPPTPSPTILARTPAAPVIAAPAATSSPLVATAPVPLGPALGLVKRGSLADDPVLTTPEPYIITTPVTAPAAAAVLLRTAAAGQAPVSGPTTEPYVVTAAVPRTPGPVILGRGALADDPVLTTASPMTVTAPTIRPPVPATMLRNPAPDAVVAPATATLGPLVVAAPAPAARSATFLSRAPAVALGPPGPITAPIVVTAVQARPRGLALTLRPTRPPAPPVTDFETPNPALVSASTTRTLTSTNWRPSQVSSNGGSAR